MTSAENCLLVANVACAVGTFIVGLIFIMTPMQYAQLVAKFSYVLIIPIYGIALCHLWFWKSVELPSEKETESEKKCTMKLWSNVKLACCRIRHFLEEQPDQPTHPFYCFLNLISLFAVEFMMFEYARETYYLVQVALEFGSTDGLVQQGALGTVCVVAYLAAIMAYEYEVLQLYKQKRDLENFTEA